MLEWAGVATAHQARFTRIAEWSLVRFARGLFAPDGPEGGWEPEESALEPLAGLAGSGAERAVFQQLLPVLSTGTWRFLARNGGFRKRDVIAGGRKRTGRLWDEAIWGARPLAFSAASVLWLAAIHDSLVALATDSKEGRGYPRTLSTAEALPMTAGDRLALSVALLTIAREPEAAERLPPEVRALARRLPLLGLAQPRWLDDVPSWSFDDEQELLALQYCDDAITRSWTKLLTFRRKRRAPEQRQIDASLLRAFDALFTAAAKPGREMLLVPIAHLHANVWRENGGMDEIHKAVTRISAELTTQGDREALEHGFGTVLASGVRLDGVIQAIQATPWADRTESQKRLAAEFETHYRPVREEVRVLARRLRRELG